MRRCVLPAILLLHCVLFLFPAAVNLCVHTDGTVRLESALFPCCADEGDGPAGPADGGPGAERTTCNDCVDYSVPPMKDAVVARAPVHETPAEVVVPAPEPVPLFYAAPDPTLPLRLGCGPPRGAPPGRLLENVFLRC